MCALGVAPATGGQPRPTTPSPTSPIGSRGCANATSYSVVRAPAARLRRACLRLVLGLSGIVNLIALGLVTCALASAGIACLSCALRLDGAATMRAGCVLWLVVADATFFDIYAAPIARARRWSAWCWSRRALLYLGRGPAGLPARARCWPAPAATWSSWPRSSTCCWPSRSASRLIGASARRGGRRLALADRRTAAAIAVAGTASRCRRWTMPMTTPARPTRTLLHSTADAVDSIFGRRHPARTDRRPRG